MWRKVIRNVFPGCFSSSRPKSTLIRLRSQMTFRDIIANSSAQESTAYMPVTTCVVIASRMESRQEKQRHKDQGRGYQREIPCFRCDIGQNIVIAHGRLPS